MIRNIGLLLTVAVIVLAIIWYRTRERKVRAALIGTAGALVVFLLIVVLVRQFGAKSDQELIVEAIQEMGEGVKAKDVDRIFRNVSDSFQVQETNKEAFRQFAKAKMDNGEVTEVRVWEFEEAHITPAQAGRPATAKIRFKTKPVLAEGATDMFWVCEAEFVKEADGKWRLRSFQIFRGFPASRDPDRIPGL